MKVVGYLFCEEENLPRGAVGADEERIVSYASGLGGKIFRIYRETEASLHQPFAERAEGGLLLSEIENGDSIVVARFSWIATSASDVLILINDLASRGISLYCLDLDENITLPQPRQLKVTEGAAVIITKLLAALASNEASSHATAIRTAKRKMKREGKYLGGPVPFGWQVVGQHLVRDRKQQKIIREMLKLKEDRWSYRDIATKLAARHGLHLSHEGVRKILRKHSQKESGGSNS